MTKKQKDTAKKVFIGFLGGIASGCAGAGGGMVVVPFLKKMGFDQKSAQQNAVAVILPMAAISAAFYILGGYVNIKDCLLFLPTGLIGSVLGTYTINKISPVILKIIFGAFMVYAGGRLLFR